MKLFLPFILFGIALPSHADMVVPDNSSNSAFWQFLHQRFATTEFRDLFAPDRFPSLALYRVANNPGLGIGLRFNRPEEVWGGTLFPEARIFGARATLARNAASDEVQSADALSTPEPAAYAILGAAIGGILFWRRRKR